MGSKRTKEDDVLKISTSVFVTNFPEQASAKDLWNACKQYGHVVDAFIPNKRSKAGKRFGFVRFIKVFDVERLVGNLCTVWIGRHRIHANAARFHRPKGSTSSHQPAMKGKIRDSSIGNTKDNGHRDDVSSYANVVKNQSQGNGENDSKPVLVLDDSCVNTQDYSCCLNGKVKEVGVLENLKVALGNEGFTDIDLRYMGGLWVMIAFDSVEAKEKFLLSTGVCSWFSQLIQASSEFITDERVTMVEIEGIPLKVWNENTFIRIASKWGTLLNVENLEKENYHCKRLCVLTKSMSHIFESFKINYKGKTHWVRAIEIPGWTPDLDDQNDEESDSEDEECEEVFKKDFGESDEEVQGENDVSRVSDTEVEEENPKSKDGVVSSEQNGKQSEDPFNIYSLLNKDKMKNNKEASTKESLEYPPGFTPRENDVENVEMDNQKDNCDGEFGNVNNISDEVNFSSGFNTYKKAGGESMDSDHCRESEGSRKGGSILMLMDELVKVGQTMGYNMDGCMKNIEEIIESQGVDGHLVTFGIAKDEDFDLYWKLVVGSAWRKQMPKLAVSLGLGDKMPDMIEELISRGQQVDAVHFTQEVGLVDKFPPVPLLKAFLKDAKKAATSIMEDPNNSGRAAHLAARKEQSALKVVIKCIEEYKLEAEFPSENLKKRLEQLEKVKVEKKRPAAASPANKRTRACTMGPMPPAKAGRITNTYVSSFPAPPPTYVRSPQHTQYHSPPYVVPPQMYGHGNTRSPPANHYTAYSPEHSPVLSYPGTPPMNYPPHPPPGGYVGYGGFQQAYYR
ncbi:DIE2/ALG10 family protein [Tanacetum coccineum]